MSNMLFVISRLPTDPLAKEALDALLTASAFQQKIAVLFIQQGIWQLCQSQELSLLSIQDISSSWQALSLYDIEDIYMCESSLRQNAIEPAQLVMPVKLLSLAGVRALMTSHTKVFNY